MPKLTKAHIEAHKAKVAALRGGGTVGMPITSALQPPAESRILQLSQKGGAFGPSLQGHPVLQGPIGPDRIDSLSAGAGALAVLKGPPGPLFHSAV